LIQNALNGPDQLRQRMAFTLGQIWVVSGLMLPGPVPIVTFEQVLHNHALSNYREFMQAVSLSATMGYYLNVAENRKADPILGTHPNENYARELLQLFTIGTVMLNLDGTPQVDEHQQPIPTYEQSQIEQLARVFTGWTYPVPPGQPRGHPYFVGQMVAYEWRHDTDPKVLFGQTLPAGQTA